ncbi:hypothetical protein CcarbDRAFT_0118 [Clostridium carboxidivorans P7]|uniref:Uncharacterized protein n=1 Tax=Clostridium carboxidivorans P7 TaxID=536227 RepID=C6PMV1_9CLOT|nr:hypothetical protein [Clostridium carboxidivorans]EET89529.1 hypothetical protein CcarbDRAFT_0118 [Clostridium carboxidivorans P7]
MISILKEYEKRKTKYNLLLKKQEKRISNLSNLRLAAFLLGFVIFNKNVHLKIVFHV